MATSPIGPNALVTAPTFVGAARAQTERNLGGPCNEYDSYPTVLTTVSIVIQANPDRVGLVVINNSTNQVFFGLNSAVSATNGISLPASGGSMTLNVNDDFTLAARTWYGIAVGGTAAIYVLEIVRQDYYKPGLEPPVVPAEPFVAART